MRPERLKLALDLLTPGQWERFEEFASPFLVVDHPGLRTVAGPNDRGRDAEIVEVPGDAKTLVQYSVSQDWTQKIRDTAKKIRRPEKGFPDAQVLVYATNKAIGTKGDEIKKELRQKHNLFLDICDRSYFVDRFQLDGQRQASAEALAEDIVDPYLASDDATNSKAPALSSQEARAACVYLALQWADDSRDKGLTKLSFEALAKSVLRGTDSDNRLARSEVESRVAALLPDTSQDRVKSHTSSALDRLAKTEVRHWKQQDEFCLSESERMRLKDRLEDVELEERELAEAITWETAQSYEAFETPIPGDLAQVAQCVRGVVEAVLLKQGEVFAAAVSNGQLAVAAPTDLGPQIAQAMSSVGLPANHLGGVTVDVIDASARTVLFQPTEPVQGFFRSFADAYTLFSFLRETPDVQRAVRKMFSVGEIWLDTSVLLPLFAEELIDDRSQRRYTSMFKAARAAGLRLFVTEGVLEEINAHMSRSVTCCRSPSNWDGRVPFLFATYTLSGLPEASFPTWLEEFRGSRRPQQDIADYLRDEHGIQLRPLTREAESAPTHVRGAVQEIWHETHEKRRGSGPAALDANTRARLVAHDVENFLGVVGRRRTQANSALGYQAWWLTLDRTAFGATPKLKAAIGDEAPDSPVMSPDFMISYLALGPARSRIPKDTERALPLTVGDLDPVENMPAELLEEAKRAREALGDPSDRVVRRRVRDRLDAYRRREGEHARGGMRKMEEDLAARVGGAADVEKT